MSDVYVFVFVYCVFVFAVQCCYCCWSVLSTLIICLVFTSNDVLLESYNICMRAPLLPMCLYARTVSTYCS